MKERLIGSSRKVVAALAIIVLLAFIVSATGCAWLESKVNDLRGDLIGVSFEVETYDNYGSLTMTTHGDKIKLTGNRTRETTVTDEGWGHTYVMSSVMTVTIDGKELETCGDTCIFAETGLDKEMDFTSAEFINSHSDAGDITDNTILAYYINQYKNLFGKSRVVVIKSQMGQPLCAYSGDKVYWEIPDDLPKTTKLMVDGKALYIHRANFQIIDKALL